ncbi:MAG: hypothetical protein IJS71_02285 [Clostridia bacterium]|nr:hypothetical protein [Clostridia bacterium]
MINLNRDNSRSVTVNFKGVREYTIWGDKGIEAMGAASSVEIFLSQGDAKFIEFKTF